MLMVQSAGRQLVTSGVPDPVAVLAWSRPPPESRVIVWLENLLSKGERFIPARSDKGK